MNMTTKPLRHYAFISLSLLLLLTGCGQNVVEPGNNEPSSPPSPSSATNTAPPASSTSPDKASFDTDDVKPEIAAAHTAFALDLFQDIDQERADENLLLSPVSIATALAMTANGADGDTQEAMLSTLHMQNMDNETRNRGHEVLLDLLRHSGEETQVLIANSLWGAEGYPFKPTFLDANRQAFNAEIATLNLQDPGAADRINHWVSEHTDGKIEDMVEGPIDEDTILFLLNAVYFKANWIYQFDKELTTPRSFTNADGSTNEVDMMHKNDKYQYLQDDEVQVVRLPYQDRSLSMLVFLPEETIGLDAWLAQLTPERWNSYLSGFSEAMGDFRMPRFAIEDEIRLNEPLKRLGMEAAFDPEQANFSEMTELEHNRIYLHEAKHKSTIEVGEYGTVATASTSVEMREESGSSLIIDMEVNRPFFFAIYDARTSSILFMGAIRDID